jgi:hypothetical protein
VLTGGARDVRTLRRLPGMTVVLSLAALGTPANQALGASDRMITAADRASFERLERTLGGRSGFAVSPLGSGHVVQATGRMRTSVAWSTSKVP